MGRVRGWLQSKRHRWLLAGAVLLLVLLVNQARGKLPEVEVARAERGPLVLTIAASGKVEGISSDLSFNDAGKIREIYVREGDEIRAEEALARIEPGLALGTGGGATDVIRAPFEGWVVNIYQREGTVVQQGAAVMRVVRRGVFWVTAYLDSEDAAWLKPGGRFTARAGGYLAQPWPLEVESIGKEAIPREDVPGSARQVRVRLRPTDARFSLPVGTPVDIDGDTPITADALLIPAAAVVRGDGKSKVWTVRAGQARAVEVRTGANNFRQVTVESGLSVGDVVVVEGKTDLVTGRRVRSKPWSPKTG